MVDPSPDELVARYEGGGDDDLVVRHGGTFDVDAEAFERLERRADRWGVGAFVRDDDGRVLFVREDEQWFLPGGRREPDESLAEGAVREVREETGVDVEVSGLAAISEQTFRHGGTELAFHFATFDATPVGTTVAEDPGRDGEGIERAAWFDAVPSETFDRELVERLFARGPG